MKNKIKGFVDFLVILVNFSYGLSIIGGLVDIIPIRFVNIRLFVPLIVAYLFRFGFKFSFVSRINRFPLLLLWLLFVLFESLQGILLLKLAGVDMLINIAYYLVFMSYLYNMYCEHKGEKPFETITRPYRYYGLYNMVAIFIAAILIMTGLLSASSNDITDKFNLFSSNVLEKGINYCFPGYLTVCDPYEFRILAFLNVPDLNGLSHETQALCYSIMPAFFLTLGLNVNSKTRSTVLLYCLLIITLIIAPSATAMLCIMFAIVVEIGWKCLIKKQSRILLLVAVFIVVALSVLGPILIEYSSFLDGKLTDSSSDYSKATLTYVVTPKSFLGDGILISKFGDDIGNVDIGWLSCCFVLLFFSVIMIKTFLCIFSKDTIKHYIGMASLYFWLHSLKLSVQVFTYPYYIFILFLLAFADTFAKSEIKKDSHTLSIV